MPDHLGRGTPAYGTSEYDQHESGEDPDTLAERAWLQSAIRCFLENQFLGGTIEQRPAQYRTATYWWCVALDTAFKQKTGRGLEQFSSPETADAVRQLLGKSIKAAFDKELGGVFCSLNFPFQWLGLRRIV